jgi:hypothetical protein
MAHRGCTPALGTALPTIGEPAVSNRNTVVRSLHDLGAAAWFGGSLMGAIGLNGASHDTADPADRARLAADGWARWSPVAAAAIGAHLLGGLGLVVANRRRVRGQNGVTSNTAGKAAVTAAAVAATAYSGMLGARVAAAGRVESAGGTEPAADTAHDVASAQRRLRLLQWAIPALTGVVVVLGAQQGEQQRPAQIVKGIAVKLTSRWRAALPGRPSSRS